MDSMEGYLRANQLELKYRIEAETFSGRKFSRVRFANGLPENKQHIVERNIQLQGMRNDTEQHCFEETVFVKEGTRDIQSAIKFRMSYTLIQREPRSPRDGDPLPNINQFPILNQQEASKTFQATFEKDCGDNDFCESNMVTVANLDLPQGEDGVSILELGELQEVVLDISVTNTGESAYEAGLYVTHPASLSFIGRVSEANQLLCNAFNSTTVTCSLGNPFKHGYVLRTSVVIFMLSFIILEPCRINGFLFWIYYTVLVTSSCALTRVKWRILNLDYHLSSLLTRRHKSSNLRVKSLPWPML